MNTYRLKIDGMGCTHCVSKVTRILKESGNTHPSHSTIPVWPGIGP